PGEVEDQLVQEGRLERGGVQVLGRDAACHPVLERDLQAPGQRGRAAEQLLVEVVADPADALRHQQGGRDRVHELGRVDAVAAQPPQADHGRQRDAAPDAEAAVPDREHAVPDVRDVHRGGDVEVDPAADDPGRDAPQRDVAHDVGVAADGPPPPPGDDDRQGDADQARQGVEVNDQRADAEAVDRRAGNVCRQGHRHRDEITQDPGAQITPDSTTPGDPVQGTPGVTATPFVPMVLFGFGRAGDVGRDAGGGRYRRYGARPVRAAGDPVDLGAVHRLQLKQRVGQRVELAAVLP